MKFPLECNMDIINKIEPSGTQREKNKKNCKPLYDYVRYVSKIKENKKLNMPTEEAVNKAVDWAIKENLFDGFFKLQKEEILGMRKKKKKEKE